MSAQNFVEPTYGSMGSGVNVESFEKGMFLQGTQETLREPCSLKPVCCVGQERGRVTGRGWSSVRSLGSISYLFLLKEYHL